MRRIDPPDQPLLAEAGELLFGSDWQVGLMQELRVSAAKISHWLTDEEDIPTPVWRHILARLSQHRTREKRWKFSGSGRQKLGQKAVALRMPAQSDHF